MTDTDGNMSRTDQAHLTAESFLYTGALWVTLTIHGKRAFASHSSFRELRGSERFREFLDLLPRSLSPEDEFAVSSKASEVQREGYWTGVFNQYPVENEFGPVYELRTSPFHLRAPLPEHSAINEEPEDGLDFHWYGPSRDFPFAAFTAFDEITRKELERVADVSYTTLFCDLFAPLARQFLFAWSRWRKWLTVTRNGFFQVWMKRELASEIAPNVLKTSLELNTPLDFRRELERASSSRAKLPKHLASLLSAASRSVRLAELLRVRTFENTFQWEMVRTMLSTFLENVDPIASDEQSSPLQLLKSEHFNQIWYKERQEGDGLDLPLRWKHTVLHFWELRRVGEDTPLSPDRFDKQAKLAVSGLLEGVPIRRPGEDRLQMPPIVALPTDVLARRSAASWEGELLLASSDSTLLCTLHTDFTLFFDNDIKYSDYWRMILRGLAHLCEMRVLARLLRAESAELLDRSLGTRDESSTLSQEALASSMLLARLRTASDSATIARGDYAADKFRLLAETFDIPQVIEATQRNIELVNAGLSQEDSLALERNQFYLNLGLSAFVVVSILLALPSFWESSQNLGGEDGGGRTLLLSKFLAHRSWVEGKLAAAALVLVGFTIPVLLRFSRLVWKQAGAARRLVRRRNERQAKYGREETSYFPRLVSKQEESVVSTSGLIRLRDPWADGGEDIPRHGGKAKRTSGTGEPSA